MIEVGTWSYRDGEEHMLHNKIQERELRNNMGLTPERLGSSKSEEEGNDVLERLLYRGTDM